MRAFLLSILLFGIVRSSDVHHETGSSYEESLKRGLSHKCAQRETVSACIAHELVGYVDRMLRTASVQLSEDAMIVDESNGAAAEMAVKPESLARGTNSLEDQAQQLIMDKLMAFATTRSLRYRLLDNADLVLSGKTEKDGTLGVGVSLKAPKAVETGRARNKNIGPFLAAAAVKFGLLGALTFKGLTLMVGKALLISKIALLLATIIGLKKLFSHQGFYGGVILLVCCGCCMPLGDARVPTTINLWPLPYWIPEHPQTQGSAEAKHKLRASPTTLSNTTLSNTTLSNINKRNITFEVFTDLRPPRWRNLEYGVKRNS